MMTNKAKLQTFLTEIQDGDHIKRRIVTRANLDALDKAVYLWFVQQRCKEHRSVVHDVVTKTVSHSQACQALESVLVYLE